MKRVLSLGAGVQSSTLALMSEVGYLPRLDAAIFADTGDEPTEVYDWLAWLTERVTQFPIRVVSRGYSIEEHVRERVAAGRRIDCPPWFVDTDTVPGPINRDCTREWKINVVRRATKEMVLGLKKGDRWPQEVAIETWIGISIDEKRRMVGRTEPWQRIWHPLIEGDWDGVKYGWRDRAFSREGCKNWLRENDFPIPPESSCWHCPYHDNARWRHIRDTDPESFEKACSFDEMIRSGPDGLIHGMGEQVYLHRSLVPLRHADLGQDDSEYPLFNCGVCNT